MIILAHDGSLYGEWVARYAIRFAAFEADRKLITLHVQDGKTSRDIVDARIKRLELDCQKLGLIFDCEYLSPGQDVYRSLRQAIPHDPDALLVCGTRVKPRHQALLSGSVAEKLLRTHQCPVLALRVVQPGLLGAPATLFLPLAGHALGMARFWPVFSRLVPHLKTVYLFRALNIHYLRYPHLSRSRERSLRDSGLRHLDQVVLELQEKIPQQSFTLNRRVVISSDWSNEVLTQASRIKAQMILLGVSERNQVHRMFHGVGLERVLQKAPCDVGVYRGP